MNTPLDRKNTFVRLTASIMIACVVLTAVMVVSCQVKEEKQWKHPLAGCWVFEGVRSYGSGLEEFPSGKHIKFVGDYGDLTFVINSRNGINMKFSIGAMEHRLRNDTLVDAHGRPLEYKLDENQLTWRWHVLPGEEWRDSEIDQLERWSRTMPDSQLVDMFRAITYPEQARSTAKRLNGVWHLDSVVTAWDHPLGKGSKVDVYTRNRKYLVINEPFYMQILYTPFIDEQVMYFEASGSCGEMHEGPVGYISQSGKYYRASYRHEEDSTFLTYDIPSGYNNEVRRFYYRRVPMPDYLRRIFRPALTIE